MEDQVNPMNCLPLSFRLDGGERLKVETLGSELNPKTLKPGSISQKYQMKGPVEEMKHEWYVRVVP